MAKRHGKRYEEALKKVLEAVGQNGEGGLEPLKAVAVAKDTSITRFDGTVEVHVRLGIDVRHADQQLRSAVTIRERTRWCQPFCRHPSVDDTQASGRLDIVLRRS